MATQSNGDRIWFRIKVLLHCALRFTRDLAHPPASSGKIPANSDLFSTVLGESVTALWGAHSQNEFPLLAGKVENLRVAAAKLNGKIYSANIGFSFWKSVGVPWRWKGFVLGRELREGCLVPSMAGGICQLSNAIYECALQAGMEIIERHAHSAQVPGSAAESGRDATVFWNYLDLRFRAPYPFQLTVHLSSDSLIVRLLGARVATTPHATANTPGVKLLASAAACDSCGVAQCGTHRKWQRTQSQASGAKQAFLLSSLWPEFIEYSQKLFSSGDTLMVSRPTPGEFSTRNKPYSSAWLALRRSLALRRVKHQGAERQRTLLKFESLLASKFASRLLPEHTHLIVSQGLLPFLWSGGYLGGRTFDVLMERIPLDLMQAKLDRAKEVHPQSRTLADFRADPALVTAERAALACANKLITPHAEVAQLFGDRTVPLGWILPRLTPKSFSPPGEGPELILFPGPTAGRKGAYAMREWLKRNPVRLRTVGAQLEGNDFWRGIAVEHLPRNAPLNEIFCGVSRVVLPAVVEPNPRLLLAAMALRIPIYVTPACGIPAQPGVFIITPTIGIN